MQHGLIHQPAIGKTIQRRRHALGLTLSDFGLPKSTVSRIETGERVPSPLTLVRIADALKTTALELATGSKLGHCPFCRRG